MTRNLGITMPQLHEERKLGVKRLVTEIIFEGYKVTIRDFIHLSKLNRRFFFCDNFSITAICMEASILSDC